MKMKRYLSKSIEETQKIGEELAKEIDKFFTNKNALLIGLEGELGGGKTTFVQGFAKGLGIKERILSPTFIILKKFKIRKKSKFKNFYHIDCYRLSNYKDLLSLGFQEILNNKENIIAIEWPEKVKEILPSNYLFLKFDFIDFEKRRIIFGEKRNPPPL